MSETAFWTKEEFEDRLIRGMLAIYDYRWNFEFPESQYDPHTRFTAQDWKFIRALGVYFPPKDRLYLYGAVDLLNDGLPDYALLSFVRTPETNNNDTIPSYLDIHSVKKINRIEPPFLPKFGVAKYQTYSIYLRPDGGCVYRKWPVVIDREGNVHVCDRVLPNPPYGRTIIKLKKFDPRDYERVTGVASFTISGWADRRHFWNVQATDGVQKVLFGAYQEEIKSLFYARQLPITASGRLRPILHWVRAHRRRLKNGVDVEIEQYLRGTDTFEMDGFQFRILRPARGNQGDESGNSQANQKRT